MNLHWIDWSIVVGLLVFVTLIAIYVKKYTKGVADFLSANRCAGRYVLSTAEGIASLGAISMVAVWGMYYEGGFSINWWMMMTLPVSIILSTTGFVIYRYRETRSMTVGQFFERRYSRKFRIFAQILAFTSGILNFGIFPSVGARFFMYYIDLPKTFDFMGITISTFAAIMFFLIGISLFFTFLGGQIAVIVTDFFQGFFCNVVFLVVLVVLFMGIITWGQIHEALADRQVVTVNGQSLALEGYGDAEEASKPKKPKPLLIKGQRLIAEVGSVEGDSQSVIIKGQSLSVEGKLPIDYGQKITVKGESLEVEGVKLTEKCQMFSKGDDSAADCNQRMIMIKGKSLEVDAVKLNEKCPIFSGAGDLPADCNQQIMVKGNSLEVIKTAKPGQQLEVKEQSLINPMKIGRVENFSVWYFIIATVGSFYAFMSWQGAQGYNSSAKSPHEAKMAKIVNGWKDYVKILLLFLLPIAIYTVMHHSAFAKLAAGVNAVLAGIENTTVRKSMTVPIALAHFLPIGLKGALCAVVLSAFISTHDTYLHSWGSIFIQDVVMPFRKKPFSTKIHMLMLRLSVTGVAIFIFIWSLFYDPKEQILMYFALTGAIYLGGSGAVLVGGLYWKRGTALGAWGAMIVGSTLALGALVLRQWFWEKWFGVPFPINGQWMYAITMGSSVTTYVVLSLIENKVHDMDKLFHRGKYKVESDHVVQVEDKKRSIRPIWRKLGMNEEFSKFDRFLFFSTIIFTLFWWVVFIVGTIYALKYNPSDDLWMKYWIVRCWIFFVIAVICTFWVGIGGIFDIISMFKLLSNVERKADDDGFVKEDGTDGTS